MRPNSSEIMMKERSWRTLLMTFMMKKKTLLLKLKKNKEKSVRCLKGVRLLTSSKSMKFKRNSINNFHKTIMNNKAWLLTFKIKSQILTARGNTSKRESKNFRINSLRALLNLKTSSDSNTTTRPPCKAKRTTICRPRSWTRFRTCRWSFWIRRPTGRLLIRSNRSWIQARIRIEICEVHRQSRLIRRIEAKPSCLIMDSSRYTIIRRGIPQFLEANETREVR